MRSIFISLFLLAVVGQSTAQSTINSPYSTYGIGERNAFGHATFTSLGGASIAYFDSTVLNFYNPASYSFLGAGQPLFSLGINTQINKATQAGTSTSNYSGFIDHFAMAFTLKKRYGLAFGLKPFSQKGYEIIQRVAAGTDSVKYTYIGTGGTNQFFVGLSAIILKSETTSLSIGTNLNYLFGTATNERRSQLIGSSVLSGGIGWENTRMNAFHYELGAAFSHTINERHVIHLAAVLEPTQQLNATRDNYLFYGAFGDPSKYDTLSKNVDNNGKINMPNNLTIGANYNYWFNDVRSNNSVRNSELSVHVNYSTADWTRYSTSFGDSTSLKASSKISVGFQYIPERKFIENKTNMKFAERLRYRVGMYYNKLPYSYNNEQFTDMGATVGIGIPILAQISLSSVNLGFAFGKRSTGQDASYNNTYMNFNFGVTISPSLFERWFIKRKLD